MNTTSNNASNTPKPLPYAHKGDLTNGTVGKHLVRLTLPMIWGIFAIISVQVVDTYFIGQLGTKKLAAITFTFPVTMIITHLVFGINVSMASVVARLIGAKDMTTARRVVFHGLTLAFMVSCIISLVTYILLNQIFTAMGADAESLAIIRQYMPIWLIGVVFLSIPSCGNSAIRAAGDAKIPALVMSVVALVNLILDPILIFGKFGFPALDVQGAAYASMAGYLAGLSVGVFVIFKKNLICRDGLHLDKFKNSLKRLAFIAIPASLANVIQPLTGAVIIALLANYGTEAVAAYGIASRIETLTLIAVIALSTAMTPVVGQNWGAKIFERVRRAIALAIKFNIVWSLFAAAILVLCASVIARAFSDNEEVIRYVILFFWVVPASHALGNLVFGWASAFNAIGKPQYAFLLIVMKSIVLMIPAVWLGSYLYGVGGIFGAIASVNFVSGGVFHLMSRKVYAREESSVLNVVDVG